MRPSARLCWQPKSVLKSLRFRVEDFPIDELEMTPYRRAIVREDDMNVELWIELLVVVARLIAAGLN